MTTELLTEKSLSVISNQAISSLTRGLNWWQQSDGIIGNDKETTAILENLQISILQREGEIPPLIHAGMASVTAIVFGQNWAEKCTGSTLPDEEFDLTVTEHYIKVLNDNAPLFHEITAPLYHPEKGNCIVNYERLLLPCRFLSGGNVIGSVTHLKSFSILPDTPNHDDPSRQASLQD